MTLDDIERVAQFCEQASQLARALMADASGEVGVHLRRAAEVAEDAADHARIAIEVAFDDADADGVL